jgi:GntR family transcriptional regulator/MocR family aminotransferase
MGKAADLAYPPDQGLPSLRAAIASYLQVARGIRCDPGQVFITAGYRSTLDLIARALLEPGDRAWVEDPGYPPTRRFLGHAGMVPVPVPVDGEGIVVPRGVELADDARIAVVTPAHQSPLCVSLSLPRRQALLGWAQRRQAWIVEDDYDGEYRYVGRPLPALKSLDRDGRVLYAGTFSKVLFPGVRLAYLVVPEAQIETFRRASRIFQDGVPRTTQSIVSAFIDEGHFARHIQRMRRLYAERRALAAQGLAGTLPAGMRVEPQPGGMHLVVRLRAGQDDERLAARLFEHGMGAHPLSPWYASAAQSQALLLGFTNIGSLDEAERLGRRIARLA